ncbi:MAG: FtsX-like permease family protein [Alphaproteobacteria bacterium]|nr:FtsX-like permease family protein [Alphaproteobacteria bacterium]
MTDLSLILASLRARLFSCGLSFLLTFFGVMLATVLVLFVYHVHHRFEADIKGIHVVVGAKGSPLQIILSSVYHVDMPTGNIPYASAQKIMKNPGVKQAIPLALGDSAHGFRIVGTTKAYADHYDIALAEGTFWDAPFEAVVGADTGLKTGDQFQGAHGLMPSPDEADADEDHGTYKVVGVLARSGTVLDRLILTDIDSVLIIHGQDPVNYKNYKHEHEKKHHDHHHDHGHDHGSAPEITALLLTVKSHLHHINLPRSINRESDLQAAHPPTEMARLYGLMGMGQKTAGFLSVFLVLMAALSIFTGLANSLENRLGDVAVLRAIGFSSRRVMGLILCEAMFLTLIGLLAGLAGGYGVYALLATHMAPLSASGASVFVLPPALIWIIIGVVVAGFVAGMIPAWRVRHLDIARQLSRAL